MANQFCPISSDCPNDANPIGNFSSERPDAEVFISRSYGVQQDPPLGETWVADSCVGRATSTISQADANAKAQQANIACLSVVWPELEPDPDNPDTPTPVPRQIYTNNLQTCEFICADGSTFEFEVPAGTVSAFSQVAADDQAHSMACNGAIDNRICIGELASPGACVDSYYEQTVGFSLTNTPAVVGIISGALPPGMVISNDAVSFTVFGTPTSAGEYSFVVKVQDSTGYFQQKSFTIYVIEIAQDSLPNGTVGNAYSQTLTSLGPTLGTVTWAVTSGSLPAGLTLNSGTGQIAGSPTSQGAFSFTISMTDER